jgi:hypothetical protein
MNMTDIEQEVSEAMATDPHYPLGEPDAMKWAVAWRQTRDRNGVDANASQAGGDIDGWMVGWFANCMATGEMHATGGSFLNADGVQSILDGEIQPPPKPISSQKLIALLDDPRIAAAVNEKGGGRGS